MKLNNSTKRLLMLSMLLIFTISASGCRIPMDENGQILQITTDTTFKEIMSTESWFSAIFVWPLSQLLNRVAPKIGVGMGIALVTILVNLVLLAVTLRSTIQMQQMQLIQPQLERIQRKYEGRDDDASKMRQANEMNALYKKYNVNPLSSILITFIQFPIIIAMYQAVQRSAAVKTGTFLGLSLAQTPMQGVKEGQYLYIVIWLVMGLIQFVSMMLPMKLAEMKAKAEAEKHHRRPEKPKNNNMMMNIYMMGMIMVFGLMWPTAMTVYWAINSLVNIVKTLLVQKIIDKQKQEGAVK